MSTLYEALGYAIGALGGWLLCMLTELFAVLIARWWGRKSREGSDTSP
jgi:hypothetical protein